MYILGGVDEKACAETIDKWMSVLSYAPAEYNRIVCSNVASNAHLWIMAFVMVTVLSEEMH